MEAPFIGSYFAVGSVQVITAAVFPVKFRRLDVHGNSFTLSEFVAVSAKWFLRDTNKKSACVDFVVVEPLLSKERW